MADADSKTCKGCSEPKPVTAFALRPATRGRKAYRNGKCADCMNVQYRKNHGNRLGTSKYSSQRRANNVKSKYGLSRDEYIDLMLKQDFRCAVCAQPVSTWYVDHDHACCPGKKSCGKCVRGLLDRGCNAALGLLQDNVATLTRAQAYLEENNATHS